MAILNVLPLAFSIQKMGKVDKVYFAVAAVLCEWKCGQLQLFSYSRGHGH